MQIYAEPLTTEQKTAIAAFAADMLCGAQMHPQAYGRKFAFESKGTYAIDSQISTCAWGAALVCYLSKQGKVLPQIGKWQDIYMYDEVEYATIMRYYGIEGDLQTAFEIELKTASDDFDSIYQGASFAYVVWFLNDTLKWTREQIAAWLKNLT